MVFPSRTSSYCHQPRPPSKFLPYLAFILFSAFFVFKVDVIISQTIFAARKNQQLETTTSSSMRASVGNGTFHRHFLQSWGEDRAHILNNGELLTLSLDRQSGSGFESRRTFLFARIDMQIKLVHGNSAGTVTTYYVSSEGKHHDEIDFEFLGNSTGNPYTLHTNVFCQGKGDREQQFFLWFDPTVDFHTYTIVWNPYNIIFLVDEVPIRQFRNMKPRYRVPYPKDQPMRLYSSLWNADDWATQGGRVKTDWSAGPFVAAYRNFSASGCFWSYRSRSSSCNHEDFQTNPVLTMRLDRRSRQRMKQLQQDRMVYDYCQDRWRFPKGPPTECRFN